ncbi:hypothetical protein VNI00_014783 [Paramarasmius palmivorus]|uniref:Uncharacterized protein n=1 Tax=Paramarasmius palmivorus TaxID=297713 RepID=A0AAW0BQN3_9AGAR
MDPASNSSGQNSLMLTGHTTIGLICIIGGTTLLMLLYCVYSRNRRHIETEEDNLHERRRERARIARGEAGEKGGGVAKEPPSFWEVRVDFGPKVTNTQTTRRFTPTQRLDLKNPNIIPLSASSLPLPSSDITLDQSQITRTLSFPPPPTSPKPNAHIPTSTSPQMLQLSTLILLPTQTPLSKLAPHTFPEMAIGALESHVYEVCPSEAESANKKGWFGFERGMRRSSPRR